MIIYFSPEYLGNEYVGFQKEDDIRLDVQYLGIEGLVDFLQMQVGMHWTAENHVVRLSKYYKAMKTFNNDYPDNILASSFALSGISTARQCLAWRDTLAMVGWNSNVECISSRMKALGLIEQYFDSVGLVDIIREVITRLKSYGNLNDIEVVVGHEIDCLHPLIQELLNAMTSAGARIRHEGINIPHNNIGLLTEMLTASSNTEATEMITLDENDRSFEIWQFEDSNDADRYLANMDDHSFDLWINGQGKSMDNWLRMMNKPVAGSRINECAPQAVQLFILGVGLLLKPFNINTLVSWLYSPIHPISGLLRYQLGDTVCASGGFFNENCREVIDNYIKEHQDEKDLINKFLPNQADYIGEEHSVDRGRIIVMVESLKSWANQRAILLTEENEGDVRIEQLYALAEMCDMLMLLLEDEKEDAIDIEMLDSMMCNIYKEVSFSQYQPQAGCRFCIDHPSKIAESANSIIWCGVYNNPTKKLSYSFLSPREHSQLSKQLNLWNKEKESKYYNDLLINPFIKAKDRLVLVVSNRQHGSLVEKHPLIIRLEKRVANLEKFIVKPEMDRSKGVKVEIIDNSLYPAQYQLTNPERIKWPEKISATSVETLIEYPFDFFMENILWIRNNGISQLSEVRITKGNVAHAVIEKLFTPKEGHSATRPEDVAREIDSKFDNVFNEVLNEKGAIFLLKENILTAKTLKSDLKQCIMRLISVMKDNGLKVIGCESKIQNRIGLDDNDCQDPILSGMMDMVLVDNNNHRVIFDFKWTSSRKYYGNLLKENKAWQLALYAEMLTKETNDRVGRTAYFLLPQGRLFSVSPFKGRYCEQVVPDVIGSNVISEICESYRKRKHEIQNGIIDVSETEENIFTNFGWL